MRPHYSVLRKNPHFDLEYLRNHLELREISIETHSGDQEVPVGKKWALNSYV